MNYEEAMYDLAERVGYFKITDKVDLIPSQTELISEEGVLYLKVLVLLKKPYYGNGAADFLKTITGTFKKLETSQFKLIGLTDDHRDRSLDSIFGWAFETDYPPVNDFVDHLRPPSELVGDHKMKTVLTKLFSDKPYLTATIGGFAEHRHILGFISYENTITSHQTYADKKTALIERAFLPTTLDGILNPAFWNITSVYKDDEHFRNLHALAYQAKTLIQQKVVGKDKFAFDRNETFLNIKKRLEEDTLIFSKKGFFQPDSDAGKPLPEHVHLFATRLIEFLIDTSTSHIAEPTWLEAYFPYFLNEDDTELVMRNVDNNATIKALQKYL